MLGFILTGGSLHIQTAYDSGLSHLMAKNMITQVGFHVPLFKRKQYKAESRNGLYVANQSAAKVASTSSVSSTSTSSNATKSSQETNSANSIVNSNSSPSTANSLGQSLAAKPQLLRIIYFDSDKYSLNKSETAKVLAEVKVFAVNNPQVFIYLTGHTDSIKDDIYNLALSKKRVQEASDWLKAQGIAPDRIKISFKGKSNPATSNNNESGRSGNRRVEIFIN
jgi:outer membrane protein OmpA-like peptidoglycan-associated protein